MLPVTLSRPLDRDLEDCDREMLIKKFTEPEIKKAVFAMKHNRAPGPDGFPIEFFQKFWNLVCTDLIALFEDFFKNKLDISRLNYGIIILIAKGQGLIVYRCIDRFVCLT